MTALRVVAGILATLLTLLALLALRQLLAHSTGLLGVIVTSCAAALAVVTGWFAARGHRAASRVAMGITCLGGSIGGGVAFTAGFFGPMFLSPNSNQGPLLGVFVTGPIGFILGLVTGFLWSQHRASALDKARQKQ